MSFIQLGQGPIPGRAPSFLRPRGFAAGLALRARRPLFVLGAPPYRGGLEIADHPGLAPPFLIGSDGYG